jgi:two-component system response regulator AtoC
VEHFIRKYAREFNRDVRGVSTGALEVLMRYDWPGNVREMENIIKRSIVLAAGPVVQLQDLPLDLAMPDTSSRSPEDEGLPLREARPAWTRIGRTAGPCREGVGFRRVFLRLTSARQVC